LSKQAIMSVRLQGNSEGGVYFITITCARWLPLFGITNGYPMVYKWFDYLKQKGHYIVAFVIMPNHLHTIIAFRKSEKSINLLVGNGKRFMAYELVSLLQKMNQKAILLQLSEWVNLTQRMANKQHEVFEPSFDRKECRTIAFMKQKANYIHMNPCKAGLAAIPENYIHSSAAYYYTGKQGIYPVITYMELQDIDLGMR
jgi:REP element-mobilizing transposase RayT